jgi:hypothetical protein
MTPPRWMSWVLSLAGLYNLVWGSAVVLFPAFTFRIGGLYVPGHDDIDPVLYFHLWQCIGMIVGVYGVGYLIAATNPARHWPVVLVGFLGKLLGPLGAVAGIVRGELPVAMLWTNLTNDFIWLVPFALILHHAYRVWRHEGNQPAGAAADVVIDRVRSPHDAGPRELSLAGPVLVMFLRHYG